MLVDLTAPLNEQTPVYPGDPTIKIESAGVVEKDGYSLHLVSMGTHLGTHIDAPAHTIKGGKTLDQFSIETFAGRGVYIDARQGFNLEKIKGSDIQEGDIVLLHTGRSEKYSDRKYFEDYLQVPDEVAAHLVSKKIKMIGMDMCSPDHPPYKIHDVFLGAKVLIIENLTNLAELAGKNFRVYAFPIKLDLDGAPARVVAELK